MEAAGTGAERADVAAAKAREDEVASISEKRPIHLRAVTAGIAPPSPSPLVAPPYMLRLVLEWLALGLLVAVCSYADYKHLQDDYVVICGSVLLSSPPPYFIFGKLIILIPGCHRC
ncbi:hypothetical protein VPH35_028645 [Triticum aestivum]